MFLKYMLLFVMLLTALHNNIEVLSCVSNNKLYRVVFLKGVPPACILHSVDGSLTLFLPALHISLRKIQKTRSNKGETTAIVERNVEFWVLEDHHKTPY